MAQVNVNIVVDPLTGNFTYESSSVGIASQKTGASIPMTRKANGRNTIKWTCDHPFVVNFGDRSPFSKSTFRSPSSGTIKAGPTRVRGPMGRGVPALLAVFGRFPYAVAVSVEHPKRSKKRLVFIDGCPEVCVEC